MTKIDGGLQETPNKKAGVATSHPRGRMSQETVQTIALVGNDR